MKRRWMSLAGLAVAAAILGSVIVSAQTANIAFDPAHPFTKLTAADQWVKLFVSGKPSFDANDRFHNMTSREWAAAWEGRKPEQRNLSSDAFLASLKGSGGNGVEVRSPYPYTSAEQHYAAWLEAAHGGTKPTRATLPDWSGDWQGQDMGVLGQNGLVRDVWNATAKEYQAGFQQLLTAELEGRGWWPADACLPDGFGRLYTLGGTYHFMMDPSIVLLDKDRPNSETRYVYTDGRGFLPPNYRFPMWYGESQGFWDGDELVVWTRDIKPWVITHGMGEYSDQLQAIERIKKIGDQILIDLTLYDPKAFSVPWHDVIVFHRLRDWKTAPPTFYECVSTNNVYHDANGTLQEHTPGEPGYNDPSDPRPWATVFSRSEKAAATTRAQGAPHQ